MGFSHPNENIPYLLFNPNTKNFATQYNGEFVELSIDGICKIIKILLRQEKIIKLKENINDKL